MSFSFFRRSTSFVVQCPLCGCKAEMDRLPTDKLATGWDGFSSVCERCSAPLWILLAGTPKAILRSVYDTEQAKPRVQRQYVEVVPGSGHYREVIEGP